MGIVVGEGGQEEGRKFFCIYFRRGRGRTYDSGQRERVKERGAWRRDEVKGENEL
jgi:hypothetical protein